MDERKLAELFNGAVPDPPPARFDYDDVAAESGRQRKRRRTALLGGSVLGIALLAGASVLGMALWKGTNTGDAASAPGPFAAASGSGNGDAAPNEVPSEDARHSDPGASAEDNSSFPDAVPKQGGPQSGNAGPTGPGSTSSGCGQADAELAAALAGELPSAASSPQLEADFPCPPGGRGVTLQLSNGTITLVVIPQGARAEPPPYPLSTQVRSDITPDGRPLWLISHPGNGATDAPFAADLTNVLSGVRERI